MWLSRLFSIFLLVTFLTTYLNAQQNQAPDPTLASPYNTMLVHLYYLQPDSYEPAIAARTLGPMADSIRAQRLAIRLKQVFDGKGLFVRLNMLPQEPDYLDTLVNKPFYTPFPEELPEVYLEKKDGKWYYSDQTVSIIPGLHSEVYPFGTDFLVNLFPARAQEEYLGLATWQWIGLLGMLLIAWLLHLIISRLFRPVVRLLAKSKYSNSLDDKNLLWRVARLASFIVILYLIKNFLPLLQLPVETMVWVINAMEIAMVIIFIWLGLSIIEIAMQYAFRFASTTEQKLDEQLLPILRRMLQIMVVIGGIIYILRLLDVNITALIAGVSIGGLALALAAQDTVKNLIGSAMIFFDKPFQIGDWIVMGGAEGEVVEVGFRSTRLQTVDSSIIAVPNNTIASAAVTNMGIRKFRMFKTNIGLTYDTPPVLLEKFIQGLRQLIETHPSTKKDNFLVYFHSFGDSSLNIYFRTHLHVGTLKDEFEEREKLAFGILKLADAMGVRFAFPTQTMFIEEMPGKTSLTPTYEKDPAKLDERLREYFKD